MVVVDEIGGKRQGNIFALQRSSSQKNQEGMAQAIRSASAKCVLDRSVERIEVRGEQSVDVLASQIQSGVVVVLPNLHVLEQTIDILVCRIREPSFEELHPQERQIREKLQLHGRKMTLVMWS